MESKVIAKLSREQTIAFLAAHNSATQNHEMSLFNGVIPTFVVFGPADAFPGSLHYMFFTPNAEQDWHFHPGTRCLIFCGDVSIRLFFNIGPVDGSYDPEPSKQVVVIEPDTLTSVRFEPFVWHRFEVGCGGNGVIAFSIHDNDNADGKASSELMEERTTYFRQIPSAS